MFSDKRVAVIHFNGSQDEWHMWSRQFLAKAELQGMKEIIDGTLTVPAASVNTQDKAFLEARKLNKLAYCELILSCKDPISFACIDDGRTTDLPDGDAKKAWTNLKDKFEPTHGASKLTLKKNFHACKLEENEDPDLWIMRLENMRRKLKLNHKFVIDDDDMILHICSNMSSNYNELAISFERQYLSTVDPIKYDNMILQLRAFYERTTKQTDTASEESPGVGLYSKQYKGQCANCGVIGHKSAVCWLKESNSHLRPKGWKERKRVAKDKKIVCSYCDKEGHLEKYCYKKRDDKRARENDSDIEDDKLHEDDMRGGIALSAEIKDDKVKCDCEQMWVGDTGASHHMTCHNKGFINIKTCEDEIQVGSGERLKAKYVGDLPGYLMEEEKVSTITLKNVAYIPDLCTNLFSITKAIENGVTLGNDKKVIYVENKNIKVRFQHLFLSKKGYIGCFKFIPMINVTPSPMSIVMVAQSTINVNTLHEWLGHPHLEIVINTAKRLNIRLTGEVEECVACALAKARKKNIPKTNFKKSKIKGERLYVDISYIKAISYGGARYCLLMVDECTRFKWSTFLKVKSDASDKILEKVAELRNSDYKVSFIRCDNAGENLSLTKKIKSRDISNLKVEFTAPYTPEKNAIVERPFAFLYNRLRAMLNRAGLKTHMRGFLWAEGGATAPLLDIVQVLKKA